MTADTTSTGTSSVRQDLLARLGLPVDADAEDVFSTHGQIVEFLDTAPPAITGWAKRRRKEVDKIESLLSGPESALQAMARPVVAPARASLPKPLLVLLGLVLLAGIIVGVYWLGRPTSNVPSMTSAETPAATPTVDAAALADLMKKVEANPKDVASLTSIAALYFNAADFKNSATFQQKILDIEPTNEQALIGAGACAFYQSDMTNAEKYWAAGVAAHPNNPELRYDLGFIYMTTGRSAQMKEQWDKVVELAPNSTLAKTVQQQVGSIKSTASPAPSATPSK